MKQRLTHVSAAVRDVMLTVHVSQDRYHAVAWNVTQMIKQLFRTAALAGLDRQVIDGFFKLSAFELDRLPKLVDSLWAGRTEAVVAALVAYNDEH